MEYKELAVGKLKLPSIGLGTWKIGGAIDRDTTKDNESIDAIHHALNLGYTHIDTAELYGDGHTEEIIGEAIKPFDRSEIIITSKVYSNHLKYDDVIAACKRSLERLQTNYIDIYLIHAPNSKIPIKETMSAMDYLIEQKLIRNIGVSNFSIQEIEEAQTHTTNKIVANQIPYSLMKRPTKLIEYCQRENILIMAYTPLERGLLLTNKTLDMLSLKYNKTKAQIALNWLIAQRGVIAIPKSTNKEHLKENLGAMTFELSDEDMKLLNKTKF